MPTLPKASKTVLVSSSSRSTRSLGRASCPPPRNPRGTRGGAATRLRRQQSTAAKIVRNGPAAKRLLRIWRPPRNVHAAPAAAPRPVRGLSTRHPRRRRDPSAEYPRVTRGGAAIGAVQRRKDHPKRSLSRRTWSTQVPDPRARRRARRLQRRHAGEDRERHRLPQDASELEESDDPDPVRDGRFQKRDLGGRGSDEVLPRALHLFRRR